MPTGPVIFFAIVLNTVFITALVQVLAVDCPNPTKIFAPKASMPQLNMSFVKIYCPSFAYVGVAKGYMSFCLIFCAVCACWISAEPLLK